MKVLRKPKKNCHDSWPLCRKLKLIFPEYYKVFLEFWKHLFTCLVCPCYSSLLEVIVKSKITYDLEKIC